MRSHETAPLNWSEAVDKYLAWMLSKEKGPKTVQCYRDELGAFRSWYLARFQEDPVLATVTHDDLVEWKADMIKGGYLPATINKKRSALKSFLAWATAQGLAPAVEMPLAVRQQVPATRWLSVPEERAVRRAVNKEGKPRDVALFELFLNVGARIEEAATLECGNVKLGERSGSVEILGKGRKRRVVELNARVRKALRDWFAVRPGGGKAGPVFLGLRGGLTRTALHRIVSQYGDRAKVGDLSAHQLRHTCAKRLIESGARLEEVAAILGHENLNTTRRYVEPGREDLRKALERLGGGVED